MLGWTFYNETDFTTKWGEYNSLSVMLAAVLTDA